MHKRIGKLNPIYLEDDWTVVRDYDEFVKALTENYKEITHISFDHDLADAHYDPSTWTQSFVYKEKTGYDCAVFTKSFYEENNLQFPVMFVHSMNPVGTEKIINLFLR